MTAVPQNLDAGAARLIAVEDEHVAHTYHPLPVVIAGGEGAWVTDVEGKRYLDLLSAYSAMNFGHRHPDLVAAARRGAGVIVISAGRGIGAPSSPST